MDTAVCVVGDGRERSEVVFATFHELAASESVIDKGRCCFREALATVPTVSDYARYEGTSQDIQGSDFHLSLIDTLWRWCC